MRVVPPQFIRLAWLGRTCASILLGGLFTCAIATAQPPTQPEYQFDHWTTDDGLPQNAVNAILQTRDGYLWLATFDGLVRFDGVRFTVFNKGNTKGIGSNRFTILYQDSQGSLWAVTDTGLVKYQAGVFTTYTLKDGQNSWQVVQIEEDETGNLQVVSRDWVTSWRDGQFITYATKDLIPISTNAVWVYGNKLAWLSTDGLHWYKQGRLNTYSIQSGLPSLNVISVFEDQYKTIWIRTRDAGLVRVKNGNLAVYPMEVRPTNNEGFVSDGMSVRAFPIQGDRKGNIWLTVNGKWLGRLRDGRFAAYTSSPDFNVYSIMNFYEDHEGNFWIGTTNGLYRAREAAIMVYTHRDGLSADNVYSIYEDRAGGLWFGTSGGGITKYKDGCVTYYRAKGGLSSDNVVAVYEDYDGNIWIGTTFGLQRLDRQALRNCHQNLRGSKWLSTYSESKIFTQGGVWAIHQDRVGSFWFGAMGGLVKYEEGYYTQYTKQDGLAENDVKAILEDRAGQLWFGTWGGLTRYVGGRFTSYTERDGLASDHIRTIYEDAEGLLWIGTYDGGLSRFKDGRFTNYTTKDGLFNNGVFHILEDGRGYFWMSSNRGIYRVNRQELNDFADGKISSITSVAYGKADGLLTLECNGGRQPAGWKTRDGRLWFPTAQGAVVIDPARVEFNQQAPPVVIEEILLNNKSVAGDQEVIIQPDENHTLEIRYQGLSFIRPEQQRYKYRLAGIDQDWVNVGNRRAAYFGHLPPGEYTFTVQAANSDGVWNVRGASLRLKVLPPFWQTWWFNLIVLMGIFALGLLIIRRRIIRLRREQAVRDAYSRQLIDSQERDRQRIAQELHDSTGQIVNLISHHALDGLEEPNDYNLVTERFAKIASLSGEAIKEIRLVAYSLRPSEIDRLGLTRALEALVDQFKSLPAIEFTCDLDQIDSAFDDDGKVHLYRIVQESLNNIVHHSKATAAHLAIKRKTKTVRIEIRDNGQGFNANDNGNRPSLGLPGINERARLLGGKAELHTAPGAGTAIIITLSEMKR